MVPPRRFGRRSAFLLMFGGVYVLYGVSLLHRLPVTGLEPLSWVPDSAFGWGWVCAGLIAILASLVNSKDWFGFTALFPPACIWSLSFMGSWVAYDQPRGWASSIVWALVFGIIFLVAGWREIPPHAVVHCAECSEHEGVGPASSEG